MQERERTGAADSAGRQRERERRSSGVLTVQQVRRRGDMSASVRQQVSSVSGVRWRSQMPGASRVATGRPRRCERPVVF